MKRILFTISLSIFLSFAYAQDNISPSALAFTKKFEAAVLTHNYDSVMHYMDAQYLKLQYKKFLKKNKQQFVDEFFGGFRVDGQSGEYINVTLNQISKITVTISKLGDENEYEAVLLISQADGIQHTDKVLLRCYKKKWGFYGARG